MFLKNCRFHSWGREEGLQNSGEQAELETKSVEDPDAKYRIRSHLMGF